MDRLPIITYHNVVSNPEKVSKLNMLKEEFEKDLIYIKEHGYEAIDMNDLFEHLYKGKKLPKKSLIIRVDDGFRNFYDKIFPLLKKYSMKSILAVIGSEVQKASDKTTALGTDLPDYLTWEELKELSNSGYVEIESHTYNLHTNTKGGRYGCKKLENESFEEYKNLFLNDLEKSRDAIYEKIGKYPNAFIFPYSAVCDEAYEVIKESNFKASITNTNTVNYKFYKVSLLKLSRISRNSSFKRKDSYSIQNKNWLLKKEISFQNFI